MSITTGLWGQAFVIDSLAPAYLLSEEVEVLEEGPTPLSIENILIDNDRFVFAPLSAFEHQLAPGRYYWSKARIDNQLDINNGQSGWVLHFAPSLTYIEAYIVQAGQVSSYHQTGFFRPYYEKTFRPRIQPNLIKITLEPGESAILYFRSKAERMSMPPEFWVEILPSDVFWSQLGKEYWSNGLFLGFVLMMLVYNLILSFYVKDKAHFFYSVYLITIVGYQLYASRLLADWMAPRVFPEHPQYLYFFKLVVYGGLVAYLGFIRSFLHLDKLLPFWNRLFRGLMVLAVPVLLTDAFLILYSNYSPDVADWATLPFTFIFLIATFVFVWPLYRTGNSKGYFVVAGILFMGLGILFTMFERLQSIEYSLTYFKIGSVLEIVAFALGLAYSRRLEARKRQQAVFELEKSQLLQEKEHAEAERLKELNTLKSELYTNITHEFRTPLTVIMGMAEEITGHEKARDMIQRNGNNMLRLVNQMLALSKLESGEMKLDLIEADIIDYLQYLTESFQSMASGKYIRLAFYSEVKELWMAFDEEKIQHIAYNLLSNAIKFTPEYGKVTLHTREGEEDGQPFLQIIVQDSGIGIPEGQLPFIFDRFYSGKNRISNSSGFPEKRKSTADGLLEDQNEPPLSAPRGIKEGFSSSERTGGALPSTGIGLALVKELVLLMGGFVSVESEIGQGSTFIVRLPIATPRIEQKSPALPNQENGIVSRPEETSNQLAYQEAEGPILLLVEDNPDVVVYIRTILEADYTMFFARNGVEGLAQAIEHIPDIIISDVMMPQMDGFELCLRLKQDERTSHIPIILLTARTTDEDKVAGLQRGADAYLTKPFNKQELLVRIQKLVEKQQQLKAFFTNKLSKEVAQQEDVAIENAFINKVKALITADINNQELTVASLCEAAHLSHTQVYRKLKALTGQTPSQFLRSVRMEKAMELLVSTDMNISQIAYEVGYNDPNYFSRSFQQEFGVTPSSVWKDK